MTIITKADIMTSRTIVCPSCGKESVFIVFDDGIEIPTPETYDENGVLLNIEGGIVNMSWECIHCMESFVFDQEEGK